MLKIDFISFFFGNIKLGWWNSESSNRYNIWFFLWTLAALLSEWPRLLFSRIFNLTVDFNNSKGSGISDNSSEPLNVPKETQKVLFYKWLTTDINNNSKYKQAIISKLFQDTNSNEGLEKTNNLISTLYNLTNTINKSNSSINISDLRNSNRKLNLNNDFNVLDLVTKPKSRVMELHNSENSINLRLLNNLNRWNINKPLNEQNRSGFFKSNKVGAYSVTNMGWDGVNKIINNYKELNFLTQAIKNQTTIIEFNSWLYKYSTLRSNSLKHSHNITMVKKLISSGFYDSSFTSNNLWNSDYSIKNSTSDLIFKNSYKLLYGNLKPKTNSLFLKQQHLLPINSLNEYETSFHYFLKRYYMFNNLHNNTIKLSVKLNTNKLEKSNTSISNYTNNQTKYNTLLTNTLRSYILTNPEFNVTLTKEFGNTINNTSLNTVTTPSIESQFVALLTKNLSISPLKFNSPERIDIENLSKTYNTGDVSNYLTLNPTHLYNKFISTISNNINITNLLAADGSNSEFNTNPLSNLNFSTKNINLSYRDLDLLNLDNSDKLVNILKSNGNTLLNEPSLNFFNQKPNTTNFKTSFNTSISNNNVSNSFVPTNYSTTFINDLYLLSIILGQK